MRTSTIKCHGGEWGGGCSRQLDPPVIRRPQFSFPNQTTISDEKAAGNTALYLFDSVIDPPSSCGFLVSFRLSIVQVNLPLINSEESGNQLRREKFAESAGSIASS